MQWDFSRFALCSVFLAAGASGCGTVSTSVAPIPRTAPATPTSVSRVYSPPPTHPRLLAKRPAPTPAPAPFPKLATLDMVSAKLGWGITQRQIYRTADGGKSWMNVAPSGIPSGASVVADVLTGRSAWLVVSPVQKTQPAFAYFTADGGTHWSRHPISTRTGSIDYADFLGPRVGWVATGMAPGGGNETMTLLETADGGKTWKTVAAARAKPTAIPLDGIKSGIRFVTPSTGWVSGGSVTLGKLWLYRTQDGGKSWKPDTIPLPPVDAGRLIWTDPPRFFNPHSGVLAVHANGTAGPTIFAFTTDGGGTWKFTNPVLPVDQWSTMGVSAWSWTNPRTGWALAVPMAGQTASPALYRTQDGGAHWKAVFTANWLNDVTRLDFVSGTIGFALQSGSQSGLWVTRDGGSSWMLLTKPSSAPRIMPPQ